MRRALTMGKPWLVWLWALVAGAAALTACAASRDDGTLGSGGDGGQTSTPVCMQPGEVLCDGDVALRCGSDGTIVDTDNCGEAGLVCSAPLGCRACTPGAQTCSGGVARQCDPNGTSFTEFACDDPLQGLSCQPDGCKGPCTPEALTRGNVGCDFYPTVTANGVWRDWFGFAVVVANTTTEEAMVTVTRGALDVTTRTVAPQSAEVIELPWVLGLKGPDANPQSIPSPPTASAIEDVGAYRLRSTEPVSVYQFSALRYENPDGEQSGCPTAGSDGCYSYTNDASILLPVHALTASYTVVSYRAVSAMQELIAITATRDGTVVEVRPSANILTGDGIAALAPGEVGSFTLDDGDVLQLFTADGPGASLSGTQVTAPGGEPLQVLSGVPAANIPSGVCCADHIEEVVPPVETLGQSYLVSMPRTPDGGPVAPTQVATVRVHAVFDDTTVTFDPPLMPPTVLDQGEVLELPSANVDVKVDGDKAIAVTQYMHAQDDAGAGDPSQSVVIPTEQFRNRYVFVAPRDYDLNRVNVIAAAGAQITLDGADLPASAFSPIGSSGYGVARIALDPVDIHSVVGDSPFGIVVYGYGAYTSYMYPGGMQLEAISELPPLK